MGVGRPNNRVVPTNIGRLSVWRLSVGVRVDLEANMIFVVVTAAATNETGLRNGCYCVKVPQRGDGSSKETEELAQ